MRGGVRSERPTASSFLNGGSECRRSGTSAGSTSVGNFSPDVIWTIGSESTTATRGLVW